MGRTAGGSWFRSGSPATDGRAVGAAAVRAALNRLVFANTPPIEILVNPFAVLVAMTALGEAAPFAARIAFFAGSLVVVVSNSTIYYAFQRDAAKDTRPTWWHAWLIFGAALNGLVWGIGSAATFPLPDPGFIAAFLPMLLAGFAGGYVASQSASLPSVVAFIWLAFTPLSVRLLLSGESLPAMTGGAMLFYGAILSLFSWTTFRSLRETILLRVEKGNLVRALETSSAKFEKITENLPGAVFEGFSPAAGRATLLHASRRFRDLYGVEPRSNDEMLRTLVDRIHPADRARLFPLLLHDGCERSWTFTIDYRYDHPARGEIWIEARTAAERTEDGGVHWYGFARDCTEDRALARHDRLLARVFETTTDGAFLTDPHLRVVTANAAFLAFVGLREDQAIGRSAPRLLAAGDGSARLGAIRAALAGSGSWRGEVVVARPDGGAIPVLLTLNVALGDDGRLANVVGVLSDISHLKATERRLVELAERDDLTGLPNRRALSQRVDQAIAEAAAAGRSFALHFVDLDGFKRVNDDHGHDVGDAVLVAAADRLGAVVRDDDAVFRFGGDEFVVLQRAPTDEAGAEQLARRLIDAFSVPIAVPGGRWIDVGVSIGVAIYPAGGTTAATLLRRADEAVYRVKGAGKRGYSLDHDNARIDL